MKKKIFCSILAVATLVLLCSFGVILGVLYSYFNTIQKNQLKSQLEFLVQGAEEEGISYLKSLELGDYRITIVDADGSVLYDSQAEETEMENHGDREEIKEAFEGGKGESQRYSATLMEQTLYLAERLSDGTVLRVSVNRDTVLSLAFGMLQPLLIIFLVAIILSVVLAGRLAKRIIEPLNTLNLEKPLANDVYDEMSPLLTRIAVLYEQVNHQVYELKKKTNEFSTITDSMREGLVLLNNKMRVLSINRAACVLLNTDESCVGREFLTIERNSEVTAAVNAAIKNAHSEVRLKKGEREYQFVISRIGEKQEITGAVVLVFDVTEQADAERTRREFTANVSHELKTPLQSIMGSAELLENGLAKKEDIPKFIGNIRQEAARLVSLIEDIIRLSQLDEGAEMAFEAVDLRGITQETMDSLQSLAEKRNIELILRDGGVSKFMVRGIRGLLTEMIYNLCDNAIKYNKEGGTVTVTLKAVEGARQFIIEDTGIGIPQEHQARVFERFYRVDKSHSRASGGTGLGLSIVKNGAKYHNARLELTSREGMGTRILLEFVD